MVAQQFVVLSITEQFFLQQKKKLKWVKSYNKQED